MAEANESINDEDDNDNNDDGETTQQHLTAPSGQPQPDMDALIENQQWERVVDVLEETPDEAQRVVNPSLGWTKLHWLCSIGSAPAFLIEMVARLYPQAITMPDNRYGDTPIHIICRNSVTSAAKLRILLSHLTENTEDTDTRADTGSAPAPAPPPPRIDGLLIRNRFGGTALHSAANHNAVLPVLKALVEANPAIIRVTTHDGMHAISALYSAYVQTIPGYMSVARILKNEPLEEQNVAHFERFWKKVEYLASAVYASSSQSTAAAAASRSTTATAATLDATHATGVEQQADTRFVLHGLLQSHGIVLNFYQLALKWNPLLYAQAVDATTGNLPLHVLLERRPFRLKERDAIRATLDAYPEAASCRNHESNGNNNNNNNKGDLPLILGVRNKIPWHNGLDLIAEASPSSSAREGRDAATGLFPFQLAASTGGRVSVETTFHLLLLQPDLLLAS